MYYNYFVYKIKTLALHKRLSNKQNRLYVKVLAKKEINQLNPFLGKAN